MQIILIAGPSGSGKSTIAWELAKEINYAWFCLDGYFVAPAYSVYDGTIYKTFEHPYCYNSILLRENILTFCDKNAKWVDGIIIEGFCIMQYPEIFRMAHAKFFLDASHEICVNRRLQRTKGMSPADNSYMIIGKREAAKYVYPQKDMAGVITIDATLDTNTILNKIKLCLNLSQKH